MTDEDPIVEEARRAGQAYIHSFQGDWKAMIADLQRRSEERGVKTVSLPPRRPQQPQKVNKKTG